MRIALTTLGSRGDVQPFAALGKELRERGHEVVLAAPSEFHGLATEARVEFAALPGAPSEFLPGGARPAMDDPELARALEKSTRAIRLSAALKVLPDFARDGETEIWRRLRAAAENADLVVNAILTRPVALTEDPPAPWCGVSWWPSSTTAAAPALGAWPLPLGPVYNRLTHHVRAGVEWLRARNAVNAVRRHRGLRPLAARSPLRGLGRERPLLYPFSPAVYRPPADWPPSAHVTGYWYLDRFRDPPRELARFVTAGSPPIVCTMGTFWATDTEDRRARMAIGAARAAGRRVVLVGGRSRRHASDVFQFGEADYRWLFPLAAVVVHHGGLGTTGEVVRAGVPQVVVPGGVDQPFWAERLRQLGVTATPLPAPKLTERGLTASVLSALRDRRIAERAELLARHVRADRGVEAAADVIERWAWGKDEER
ncbi:glycosyltransferase [Amycolatopsis sp. NPDC052450]|uniref:glycosyltransferase n=1 Tax=Amycolatopsis sp. NPDC052450 TaxID=3363937 RepID=UPI0037CBB4DD